MPHRRHRRISAIISAIGVITFVVLAAIALVWANGLTFNPETRSFDQTAVVAVDSKISGVTVTLNGQKIADRTPTQQRGLPPGSYKLLLQKDGYFPYEQTFQLAAGEVGLASDVVLIAQKPLITNQDGSARFITPSKLSNGLTLDRGELYDGTTLVTRFSTVPLQVHRFPSLYLYQLGADFHVYLPTTNQDFVVYTSSLSSYIPINAIPHSWAFIVDENGARKLINLTIPSEPEAE